MASYSGQTYDEMAETFRKAVDEPRDTKHTMLIANSRVLIGKDGRKFYVEVDGGKGETWKFEQGVGCTRVNVSGSWFTHMTLAHWADLVDKMAWEIQGVFNELQRRERGL